MLQKERRKLTNIARQRKEKSPQQNMVITKKESTQLRLSFHLRKTKQENDSTPATEEVKMMRYLYKINVHYPGGGKREVLPILEFTVVGLG